MTTPNEAEVIARVTGSRGATVRHEHRDPATGELVVDSVVTYGDVEPPEPPEPTLYGKPRPKQSHYAKIFDDAHAVGHVDVTEVVERTLRKIPTATLMFPDLYAHEVTKALLKAGILL